MQSSTISSEAMLVNRESISKLKYLLKHFVIGFIAVYFEDPKNVSRLVRYSINSFPREIQDMF